MLRLQTERTPRDWCVVHRARRTLQRYMVARIADLAAERRAACNFDRLQLITRCHAAHELANYFTAHFGRVIYTDAPAATPANEEETLVDTTTSSSTALNLTKCATLCPCPRPL